MTARVVARNARRLSDPRASWSPARSRRRLRPVASRPSTAPALRPRRERTDPDHDAEHLFGPGLVADRRIGVTSRLQPTARHKDDPVDALGEEVVEVHRDATAEGVPDEGDPLDAEAVQQVAHRRRVGAERIVSRRLIRLAVAEEVGHDHPVVVMHAVDEVGPLALRTEDPVDEQHHRPVPLSR